MPNLALYIHIPFCVQRCRYCDFASSTGKEALIPAYRHALITELQREEGFWKDARISSVFFGGGTPSLWPANEICRVLEAIMGTGRVAENAEISIEANPGTVDAAKLTAFRHAGFNRISIGAQSSEDRLLKAIGRIHSVAELEQTVSRARAAGFDNLNLDLIFGIPKQTATDWEHTLHWAMSCQPEHLSCYGLQLEEGTPLAKDVALGRVALPSEDEIADMMDLTMKFLPAAGYEQYEISNYSRPGYQCRHNLHYWSAGDYLGLGAGAVSTVGFNRWTNTEGIEAYLESVGSASGPLREGETLTPRQQMAEAVMLGLRLREGVDASAFARRFNISLEDLLGEAIRPLIQDGWLVEADGGLRLTMRSVPVSNEIIGRICGELLGE